VVERCINRRFEDHRCSHEETEYAVSCVYCIYSSMMTKRKIVLEKLVPSFSTT